MVRDQVEAMTDYRFNPKRNGVSTASELNEKPAKRTPLLVALARLLGRSAAEKDLQRKKAEKT